MKWLLLCAVVLLGPLRGEPELTPPSVRDRLLTRIKETLPPPSVEAQTGDKTEPAGTVLVLDPIVVSESKGQRELVKLLASEQQRLADEAFGFSKGGTIYRTDRLELGGWYSRKTGWQFLKIKW